MPAIKIPAAFANRLEPIDSALSHRDFRLFSIGNVASHIGTWIQRVAVGWLTWEMTRSGWWLGVVAFADLFPTVILAPVTGAVADRVQKLAATKIVQSVNLLQSGLLAAITLSGAMTIEILLLLVVFGGISLSFGQPIRLAIVPNLVPREDLTAAIGINSMIFNGARFIGPMLAGVIIVQLGIGYAFVANAASFALFIAVLTLIRFERGETPPTRRSIRNIPREIAEGYGYAARHPGIGPILIILTLLALLARPYMELLPGFADAVFGRGADGLAWLTSMTGLGALLGAAWLAQRGAIVGLTETTVAAIAVLSCALIGFAATDIFWVAAPCLVVAGFAMIVVGVGEQTLMQNAVEPALRGRVMSLYGMIGRGAPALGALVMGGLSSYVGLQGPVLGGAVICLGVWLWARRMIPVIKPTLETPPGSS